MEAITLKPQSGPSMQNISTNSSSGSKSFAIHIEFGKDDLEGRQTLLVYASQSAKGGASAVDQARSARK